MTAAVSTDSAKRALFERLVDDASLFPPAQLPMRAAVRAHARHRESAYAWLGGRFVVPASRLDEFVATRTPDDGAFELSVILDSGAAGAKGDTVRADLHRVERIAGEQSVTVSSLEARLPNIALDEASMQRIITAIAEMYPTAPIAFWYESAYDAGWRTPPTQCLAFLAAARASAASNITLGAKVRCGGATAGATPSAEDLAAFVIAAHQHDVPWKASAGLHHAVRGERGATVQHGFLNLFFAGIALHAGALDPSRVAEVLGETNPRAFAIDPAHAAWNEVRVEPEQIAAARERCVAFGSCSFDEPVNELRELGILS